MSDTNTVHTGQVLNENCACLKLILQYWKPTLLRSFNNNYPSITESPFAAGIVYPVYFYFVLPFDRSPTIKEICRFCHPWFSNSSFALPVFKCPKFSFPAHDDSLCCFKYKMVFTWPCHSTFSKTKNPNTLWEILQNRWIFDRKYGSVTHTVDGSLKKEKPSRTETQYLF